jgi:hypothetical protein
MRYTHIFMYVYIYIFPGVIMRDDKNKDKCSSNIKFSLRIEKINQLMDILVKEVCMYIYIYI